MNRHKPEVSASLNSSHLQEVKYDPFMQVMTVYFKNGHVYEYIEVPKEIYSELIEAASVGKFFNKNIRNKFLFLKRK